MIKLIGLYYPKNPNAISLLNKNYNKINWCFLSQNYNALHLLLENPDKICWECLSANPSAIDLLKKNQDKIDWYNFSLNSAIFELDYEKMIENNKNMYEELLAEVIKPSRVFKERDYDYLEELFGE